MPISMLAFLLACPSPDPVDTADTNPWQLPDCPATEAPVVATTVTSDQITECSGLVAGHASPDVWWVHNDSGDSARVFAIGSDGQLVATLSLDGVTVYDVEDLTLAPDADGADLLIGDMGDNDEIREHIVVYRVREPSGTPISGTVPAERIELRYPDGAHNAEALLWDPVRSELVLVTKTDAGPSLVYRAPDLDSPVSLERVGQLPALEGSPLVTGGDVSVDGSLVALRTYTHVWLWRRVPGEPLWSAFASKPCEAPAPPEPQGEAIGFTADTSAWVTLSEGALQPVYRGAITP